MKSLVIVVNKVLYRIGQWFHRGSSIPGQVARMLDKNILKKVKLPSCIIMVTGSNGKTSTTEMIAMLFQQQGYRVGWNREGANQIEGMTTLILNACDLKGVVQKDVLVMEADERYVRLMTKEITPTFLVVTNLFRDQMTRNGHPEWIYEKIQEGIPKETKLVLNADDPLSSLLGWRRDGTIYVGMERQEFSKNENEGRYNDGRYCPNCKKSLTYDWYHFAHIGKYHCAYCGFERKQPSFAIQKVDLQTGEIQINERSKIQLTFRSVYHAYNVAFAYAIGALAGISEENIVKELNEYIIKNDRVQVFTIEGKKGTLLTSKHENSISYNQSIAYVVNSQEPCTVVILVDAISRKYFTSETSWLWDIDFEKLNCNQVEKIILAGKYVNDLLVRFQYAGMPKEKISHTQDLEEMMTLVKQCPSQNVYLITCFADRMKFMRQV